MAKTGDSTVYPPIPDDVASKPKYAVIGGESNEHNRGAGADAGFLPWDRIFSDSRACAQQRRVQLRFRAYAEVAYAEVAIRFHEQKYLRRFSPRVPRI